MTSGGVLIESPEAMHRLGSRIATLLRPGDRENRLLVVLSVPTPFVTSIFRWSPPWNGWL